MANRHMMGAIVLAAAVLPACGAPATSDRAWFERGEHIHEATMGDWAQAAPRDQLSAAAHFVWVVRSQDDDFSVEDPGFMTAAAALRECMIRAWERSADVMSPDTRARSQAAFCQILMASQ